MIKKIILIFFAILVTITLIKIIYAFATFECQEGQCVNREGLGMFCYETPACDIQLKKHILDSFKIIPSGAEKINDENTLNFNYCINNDGCVWYVENQGDPAGRIHCSGLNYAKTCDYCEKLPENQVKSLPTNFKCFCNPNKRCQESR